MTGHADRRHRAPAERTTAGELLKSYEADARRKRDIVGLAKDCSRRLEIISDALCRLRGDEVFMSIVELEGLDTIPLPLASRLAWRGAARS